MKDIKFRAWESSRKEMIYCSFADVNVGRYRIYHLPVMQYTGLKDVNGVEIYEGDILTHRYYRTPVVCEWKDGGFEFGDVSTGDGSIEVIGNIYEHPQLTEVK